MRARGQFADLWYPVTKMLGHTLARVVDAADFRLSRNGNGIVPAAAHGSRSATQTARAWESDGATARANRLDLERGVARRVVAPPARSHRRQDQLCAHVCSHRQLPRWLCFHCRTLLCISVPRPFPHTKTLAMKSCLTSPWRQPADRRLDTSAAKTHRHTRAASATVARVSFRSDCTRLPGPVRTHFLACESKLELRADVRDDSIDLVLGGARHAAVHDSRALAALHSERHVRMHAQRSLAKRIR
jgi:hypothetical protein